MTLDKQLKYITRQTPENIQHVFLRDSPCIHQQRDCGKEGNLIQQNDVHVSL